MAPEPNPAGSAEAPSTKSRMIPILVIAALMGAEGVGVFFVAKAISPAPDQALAAGEDGGELGADDAEPEELAEIELVDSRPSNMMAGKLVTFHIRVSVLVALADLEKAERLTRLKRARLEDGVNTVIRSAEPKHFYEPDLQTIKRRLRHELDRIFGDENLVKKVLIPHLLQSGRGV